jgi:hypothetical protein
LIVLGAIAALGGLGLGGVAHADKKRVVVVLDFEGPKGERFHDELVRLLKRAHTVLSTDKWNGVAEALDAGSVSAKDIRRVARKLKVDAVVEGRVEKRRDQFMIRLRLHDGRSGDLVGSQIDTKAAGPRIDAKVERELKDELFGAIASVEANRDGGDDDDERPSKRARRLDDDEQPVKRAAPRSDDEDDKPVRRGFARRSDDERGSARVGDPRKRRSAEDEDEDRSSRKSPKRLADDDDGSPRTSRAKKPADDDEARPSKKPGDKKLAEADEAKPPPKKSAKLLAEPSVAPSARPVERDEADDEDRPSKPKQVASRDDGADQVDADPSASLETQRARSPGQRALDVVVGMSVTSRTLTFTSSSDLMTKPPGYKGIPVAGAMLDATLYPLALGHKRTGFLTNLGVTLTLDRVLKISSKNRAGMEFDTLESRYGVGAVFRIALGRSAMAPVILGTFGYASQIFRIANTALADVPSVKYSIFEPGLGLRYPVIPTLIAGVDLKVMAIPSTGQIQEASQYGAANVLGFEGALAVDYLFMPNLFVRVAGRFETVGHTFAGNGTQTNARDGEPATQDVSSARDSYFGGFVTVGYLY